MYKEIQAICGGIDFLAGGRFRSIFCNSGTPFQSNTTKNTVKIRIGAQKRVWSAGIDYVSIFPFVMDQMRTFGIFGIFIPILDVGDQFGFSRSKNTCFQHFSASAKSCLPAAKKKIRSKLYKNAFCHLEWRLWTQRALPSPILIPPGHRKAFSRGRLFGGEKGQKGFLQMGPTGWTH